MGQTQVEAEIRARRAALAKDPLYGPHCKLAK